MEKKKTPAKKTQDAPKKAVVKSEEKAATKKPATKAKSPAAPKAKAAPKAVSPTPRAVSPTPRAVSPTPNNPQTVSPTPLTPKAVSPTPLTPKAVSPTPLTPPKGRGVAPVSETPSTVSSFSFDDIASLASATAEAYSLHVTKGPAAPPPAPKAPAAPPATAKPAAAPAAAVPPAAPASAAPAPLAAASAAPSAPPAVKPLVPGAPGAPTQKPLAPSTAPKAQPPLAPATAPIKPQAPLKAGTAPAMKPTVTTTPSAPPPRYVPPPQNRPHFGAHAPKAPSAKPPTPLPAPAPAPAPGQLKKLKVSAQVTVRELAEKLGVKVNDLIKKMMGMGVFATINQRLETDTAMIIAQEFGFDLEVSALYGEEEIAKMTATITDSPADLKPRSPVVTVMGHVDHGKTSLLDAIRTARVAEKEAGGITQHIGAYKVLTPKGEIVFLDTPGHEAFTAMRARGAKVTDIVILVVSAADGVMPQTVEAIDHAKAAGVPIVVAVNKVDLPTANPAKIRQELSNHGLLSEEWGGKNIFVDVSAKKRINIDKLLEMVILQAEILELKANPARPGVGVVLEARMEAKRGNVCTLLVQTGTVKVGDAFVAGQSFGRVRALINDQGKRIQEAGPATPIEVLGIGNPVPQAGDVFNIVTDDRQAREIAEKRRLIMREETMAHQRHVTLIGLKSLQVKELSVILKADVQGSVQALKDSLMKLSTSEISLKVLHSGVGNVNESDVLLANASDAVVLAFHVDTEPRATAEAERLGIDLRVYQIIYDLIADVKAAMEGLLEPELVDVVNGKLEVRQVFNVTGLGRVAGGIVTEGKIARGATARLVRGAETVHKGKIVSLKRFKDDAKEVEKGLECGVALEGYQDYKAGDRIESFVQEKRTRRLESSQ